jgi:hypothetical protein
MMQIRQDGKDADSGWPPFAKHPLPSRYAFLAALGLGVLPAIMLGSSAERAWIRLTWQAAEAVIAGEPRIGSPAQKRGATYWPVFEARRPDGHIARGESIRPMFSEWIEPSTPNGPRRRPPQAGDHVKVRLDPDDPTRMVPERELGITPLIIFEVYFSYLLVRLLYVVFRGRSPRLAFEGSNMRSWTQARDPRPRL